MSYNFMRLVQGMVENHPGRTINWYRKYILRWNEESHATYCMAFQDSVNSGDIRTCTFARSTRYFPTKNRA